MGERIEVLIRIPLGIFYGLILYGVNFILGLLWLFQCCFTLILGRRHETVAHWENKLVSFRFYVGRYMNFVTNDKPLFGKHGFDECLPVE